MGLIGRLIGRPDVEVIKRLDRFEKERDLLLGDRPEVVDIDADVERIELKLPRAVDVPDKIEAVLPGKGGIGGNEAEDAGSANQPSGRFSSWAL